MSKLITEQRLEKFARVATARQDMTVIIENVHDPHNIGAVMRTCDSVGIQELYILYTEDHLEESRLDHVKGSATGVRKWLNIHLYREVKSCFTAVKKKYDYVYATHLGKDSKSLYDLEVTGKVAFLFGNEKEGISEEAVAYTDGNFTIPQYGMVNSLNISVAGAITLYEACRQREAAGLYEEGEFNEELYNHYIAQHNVRYNL